MLDPLVVNGFFHGLKSRRFSDYLIFTAFRLYIFRSGLQHQFHEFIFADRFFVDHDTAFFCENPGNASVFSQIAAMFRKNVPDFGHGPVFIVRHDIDNDCCSSGAIAFIGHFFVSCCPLTATDTFLDCPFNVIFGHVFFLGRHNRLP